MMPLKFSPAVFGLVKLLDLWYKVLQLPGQCDWYPLICPRPRPDVEDLDGHRLGRHLLLGELLRVLELVVEVLALLE